MLFVFSSLSRFSGGTKAVNFLYWLEFTIVRPCVLTVCPHALTIQHWDIIWISHGR